ncbi:hypothetical protein DFJ58DRAFT_745965 [Suillus subalutaceus]|uniref:uncharacterized protein n=1 Tax=Suillus subalutaceus TaxID=48586 RepID=UPI001B87C98D|nr:uncharacterized protein DFJ58DRAFT_745965 [Suillus subalutaceus]KAG1853175.1 hypothetical protein DFJ58DRAFT_745965 [Suillus subalutaceus]
MSVTNDNHPGMQSPRTWFVSWKSHSKKLSGNALDGSPSAGTCYMLYAILVVIHVVLVIFYIFHLEHRVTLPFTSMNTDFWPVVLSASLQAFYTIYTAVLLFLTQQLAMSRTLVRRQKLTAIHDISGAWTGLGSALSSVWQQIDIPASWWITSAVTVYFASISVLHVTSSTLLQLQTFNTSISTSVPTTLAWLNNLPDASARVSGQTVYGVNWAAITASLLVLNQLPGVVSAGLSNTTIYDTPKTNAILGNAIVNATTITSRCGLPPNISYSMGPGYYPIIKGNSSVGNVIFIYLDLNPPWSDQIQVINPMISSSGESTSEQISDIRANQTGVFLMVSTLLDIDPSVQETFAVPVPWKLGNSSGVLEVYFIQCSLSTHVSTDAVLDMQTNSLQNWNPVSASQSSGQWEIMQWISNVWQSTIGDLALVSSVSSGYSFWVGGSGSKPSMADEYIMSLVGLNLADEYINASLLGLPVSTFVLRPDQLEAAIARVAAQLIWITGNLGSSNGGIQPGNGTAYINEEIIRLRLNINIIPLSFAISASAIMMALALSMTRACNVSSNSQAAIQSTGTLQLLWLGHQSASVNEVLENVKHPTEANLRRAGMVDVCFAKTISDEEKLEGSTDSLAGQVDHDRDDVM